MKYIYHYIEQRIYNSSLSTTIYITPTHFNIQNTHIKQTKFWHQESLDAFNHLIIIIMDTKVIVNELVKNGATSAKNTIINVNVTTLENYTRVALTLKNKVKGYVSQEDGTYKLQDTNVIFVSLFTFSALLKQKELGFVANQLQLNPNAALVLFAGANISLLQQEIKAGEEYTNPWSEATNAVVFDHNTIINHVVDFSLTDKANCLIDKLALSLMGI